MKNNELRIGNLAYYNGEIVTINGISKEHPFINRVTIDYLEWDEIQPIPLTEEWLLKCGFNDKENQYRYKDRLIVIRDNDFHDYGTSVKLKYVHQLQNLYFALTNNELIFR